MRLIWRLFRLAIHIFKLCIAVLLHQKNAIYQQKYISKWSAKMLAICGFRLNVSNHELWQHADFKKSVLISNHISWADIFVLYSLCQINPMRFVARKEIRDWFLIGVLCEKLGCLFINREEKRAIHHVNQQMIDALRNNQTISFFPEAKTSDGSKLLPFHANLFQPVVTTQAKVFCCAIKYLDTNQQPVLAPSIEGARTMKQSLFETLKEPSIYIDVMLFPPIIPSNIDTRHDICRASEHMIAASFD